MAEATHPFRGDSRFRGTRGGRSGRNGHLRNSESRVCQKEAGRLWSRAEACGVTGRGGAMRSARGWHVPGPGDVMTSGGTSPRGGTWEGLRAQLVKLREWLGDGGRTLFSLPPRPAPGHPSENAHLPSSRLHLSFGAVCSFCRRCTEWETFLSPGVPDEINKATLSLFVSALMLETNVLFIYV